MGNVLSPDDPDPGSYVGGIWQGPPEWSRMHGKTRVDYLLGQPQKAEPVLQPVTSSPLFNFFNLPPAEGCARRLMGGHQTPDLECHWRMDTDTRVAQGRLQFGEGLALFVEDPPGPRWVASDVFEKALQEHPGIRDRLHDRDFACELYGALCNIDWKGPDAQEFSCTWRYAGGLVARLRGAGEEYIDFYCCGPEGTVSEEIRAFLGQVGWSPLFPET